MYFSFFKNIVYIQESKNKESVIFRNNKLDKI